MREGNVSPSRTPPQCFHENKFRKTSLFHIWGPQDPSVQKFVVSSINFREVFFIYFFFGFGLSIDLGFLSGCFKDFLSPSLSSFESVFLLQR